MQDLIHDIASNPLKYAEQAGLVLVALIGVLKTLHALLLAVEVVAKMTPSKADDDAVRAIDVWVVKSESGLIWLQQRLLMLRGPKAAARMATRSSMPPEGVGPIPEDPASVPTKPERPRAKG